MKISNDITHSLNEQMALEAGAAQYYLATASWCELSGYEGAAAYFYAQSDEERTHMLKILRFLTSVGAEVSIPATPSPGVQYESLEAVIKESLRKEQAVTVAVHEMLTLAHKKADYSVFALLEWFAAEQVHEETKFEAILQKSCEP